MSDVMWDVVVIGGGVVGLSAAVSMHQRGYKVSLLDAGPLSVPPEEVSPRVYAINRASQKLFEQLGVWAQLDPIRVSPYQHMHVWDSSNDASIDFDSRMIAADRLGSIIDESNLRQALLQIIHRLGVAIVPVCRVSSVEERSDCIMVLDEEQRTWRAQLLIVADGANSPTRERLGVPVTTWSYHQAALVTTVHTEKSHLKTASQVFLPKGVLAFLPLVDEHRCSIVWSTTPDEAEALMALDDGAFSQRITAAFGERLGHVEVVDKRYSFPLRMRHTQQYVGLRWILMGDAAHTIHPLAGLGLNVGLADLTAWLALVDQDSALFVTKKRLGAYQRQRKHAVWQTIAMMEGLKTLFLNPLLPVSMLRGLGLALCDRLGPLKRWLIEQAAGAGQSTIQ